nr:unnamed protein product [Callosobruchus analis]
MSGDLERRDILDALIVGLKVGEIIPGIPPLLRKCLKMWERTLEKVEPIFWGVFPKTKPEGAEAIKLPFKIPIPHINPHIFIKFTMHIIKVMQNPTILVSDVMHLPMMTVRAVIGIIKSPRKLVMDALKLPEKIMNGLTKLLPKLMNGTMKSPMKLFSIGENVAKSPFKMLGHTLHHGQTKGSKKSKKKKKFGLNLDYMNMLGEVLKHPHMGDDSSKEKDKQGDESPKKGQTAEEYS